MNDDYSNILLVQPYQAARSKRVETVRPHITYGSVLALFARLLRKLQPSIARDWREWGASRQAHTSPTIRDNPCSQQPKYHASRHSYRNWSCKRYRTIINSKRAPLRKGKERNTPLSTTRFLAQPFEMKSPSTLFTIRLFKSPFRRAELTIIATSSSSCGDCEANCLWSTIWSMTARNDQQNGSDRCRNWAIGRSRVREVSRTLKLGGLWRTSPLSQQYSSTLNNISAAST